MKKLILGLFITCSMHAMENAPCKLKIQEHVLLNTALEQVRLDELLFLEKPIGHVMYMRYNPNPRYAPRHGKIVSLCVEEPHRRKKYGTQLLNHAIMQLKKDGAQYVYLYADEDNNAAINLYTKYGFVEKKSDRENKYFELDCTPISRNQT